MTDLFDLTAHVSVVTGGGSGIGLGMADGLARAGASVAIIGRSVARLEAAAESLRAHGNPVLALPGDVTDEPAIAAAMARVRDEWGSLDSCFANAGVGGRFTPTLDTSLAEFRSITAVDLDGVSSRCVRQRGRWSPPNAAAAWSVCPASAHSRACPVNPPTPHRRAG